MADRRGPDHSDVGAGGKLLVRAVRRMARRGVDQFLDIGSGLLVADGLGRKPRE